MSRSASALSEDIRRVFYSSEVESAIYLKKDEEFLSPEIREFYSRKWDNLSCKLFDKYFDCFAYFERDDYRFFLGALMYTMIKEEKLQNNSLDMIFSGLSYVRDIQGGVYGPPIFEDIGKDLEVFIKSVLRLRAAIAPDGFDLIRSFIIYQVSVGSGDLEYLHDFDNSMRIAESLTS